jgi:hypothetical protein
MGEAERTRFFTVTLPINGNLAVGNDKAGWECQKRSRLVEAELYLQSIGTTSGATNIRINNGATSLFGATDFQIAFNAATKRVRAKPPGAQGTPSGVSVEPGDYLTVDVTAIPGVASANGLVTLLFACIDV